VNRRGLVGGVAGALAMAPLLRAQTVRPLRRIGYLHPRSIAPDHPTLTILRRTWLALGYVEGETMLLRSAQGDPGRLPALVAEFDRLGVGALIVVGSEAVRAASQVTKTLPLVGIDLETDPVRTGLAASFARPGGNVTGLFLDQPSIAGKWIELLREASPDLERLALLWDRSTGVDQLQSATTVARAKGFEPLVLDLAQIRDFDDALRPLGGRPRTGIVTLTSPGFAALAVAFAAAAQKHRLPTIAVLKAYARSGVLLSYGPIQEIYFARAVVLADRIARGERAGDLPIEGPDRFELTLNLKTARLLGLTIAQTLLLRADEVIQ
jgi:putative ABC transport system substrate-binding protein